jgi:hypothetical protein
LSAAPHAAGLSAAPHAAGLSAVPHAAEALDFSAFLFHPNKFESAIAYSSFLSYPGAFHPLDL